METFLSVWNILMKGFFEHIGQDDWIQVFQERIGVTRSSGIISEMEMKHKELFLYLVELKHYRHDYILSTAQ